MNARAGDKVRQSTKKSMDQDKVKRKSGTKTKLAEKVKEEKSDLSSELSGRDSEITLLKANEKRLVRDLAGIISNSLWKSVFAFRMEVHGISMYVLVCTYMCA